MSIRSAISRPTASATAEEDPLARHADSALLGNATSPRVQDALLGRVVVLDPHGADEPVRALASVERLSLARVYLVNSRASQILGQPVYPS